MFLILALFSLILATPCSKISKDPKSKFKRLCKLCSGVNFWGRIAMAFYLEICFFALVGTYNFGTSPAAHTLATIHCSVTLLSVVLLPFLLTASLMLKAKKIAANHEEWR